jgi:hypothetical protein
MNPNLAAIAEACIYIFHNLRSFFHKEGDLGAESGRRQCADFVTKKHRERLSSLPVLFPLQSPKTLSFLFIVFYNFLLLIYRLIPRGASLARRARHPIETAHG